MQYPLISEYVRAIQDASSNLDKLAHLVPVQDDHGEPYRSSGAFAVVFKMKDKFILMPVSIEDMDGVENFAALIIRKDNPNILDIVAEFSNTVAMFRVKPNSQD